MSTITHNSKGLVQLLCLHCCCARTDLKQLLFVCTTQTLLLSLYASENSFQHFWLKTQNRCGNLFTGTVTQVSANDTRHAGIAISNRKTKNVWGDAKNSASSLRASFWTYETKKFHLVRVSRVTWYFQIIQLSPVLLFFLGLADRGRLQFKKKKTALKLEKEHHSFFITHAFFH